MKAIGLLLLMIAVSDIGSTAHATQREHALAYPNEEKARKEGVDTVTRLLDFMVSGRDIPLETNAEEWSLISGEYFDSQGLDLHFLRKRL